MSDAYERIRFDLDDDVARAETLPARLYVDPSVLSVERERIFRRTWQMAGTTSQLTEPGSYITVEIAGEPIVLVRDRNGDIRAFHNVCRHRAGPVAEGCGRRSSLQCRYHGWTYALDGSLIGTPELEGVHGFDRAQMSLVSCRVDIWEPFVFVNLDPGCEPLSATLRDIPVRAARFPLTSMSLVERRVYEVACNWKAYVDNYLEGYHLPFVHPALMRELDYAHYRVDTHPTIEQIAPIRASSGDGPRLYEGSDADALYLWVFPNLMLNLYPDNLQLNIILPIDAERTVTIFEWYFDNPASPDVQDRIRKSVEFADEVQREDVRICEAVQRGLRSMSYSRGRYSARRENGVHHFHTLIRDRVR